MNVWNDFAKPVVVLGGICVLTGALLAATHGVTQPIIDANAIATANAARAELLPEADTFTENTSVAVDGVTEIYVADNGSGAVITAEAGGTLHFFHFVPKFTSIFYYFYLKDIKLRLSPIWFYTAYLDYNIFR